MQDDTENALAVAVRDRVRYFSARDIELIYSGGCPRMPVLTIERYEKWYSLWLIRPDGVVEPVPFPGEEYALGHETAVGDHVPYPMCVQRLAEDRGWHLDDLALELIVGRWELEHRGRYSLAGDVWRRHQKEDQR